MKTDIEITEKGINVRFESLTANEIEALKRALLQYAEVSGVAEDIYRSLLNSTYDINKFPC